MRRIHKLLDIDLHLFDGAAGGAAGSAGAEGAQQATESNLPKAETHHKRGGSRRAEKGEYDNVVFGKQGDEFLGYEQRTSEVDIRQIAEILGCDFKDILSLFWSNTTNNSKTLGN